MSPEVEGVLLGFAGVAVGIAVLFAFHAWLWRRHARRQQRALQAMYESWENLRRKENGRK